MPVCELPGPRQGTIGLCEERRAGEQERVSVPQAEDAILYLLTNIDFVRTIAEGLFGSQHWERQFETAPYLDILTQLFC